MTMNAAYLTPKPTSYDAHTFPVCPPPPNASHKSIEPKPTLTSLSFPLRFFEDITTPCEEDDNDSIGLLSLGAPTPTTRCVTTMSCTKNGPATAALQRRPLLKPRPSKCAVTVPPKRRANAMSRSPSKTNLGSMTRTSSWQYLLANDKRPKKAKMSRYPSFSRAA